MKSDNRIGCSFKADEITFGAEVKFAGDEVWSLNEVSLNEVVEDLPQLEWTRKDYGTTRLMLPGDQGPNWSQCTRRITRDLDTGRTLEDRDVHAIT